MPCSAMVFPWRKSKNTSIVVEGGIKNVIQETEEGKQFSLSTQEALHQALEYLGGLFVESVPLGYTQTGRRKQAKKRPI